MKKYKLIKTYPGSPQLGTEIEKRTIYSNNWMFKRNCNLFPVTSGTPDDYPEYWEEIVEKDYEILSFKEKGSNIIYLKDCCEPNYNLYTTNKKDYLTLENLLEICEIESVKRLSDGEIFTVGDNVSHYAEYVKNEFSTKDYILEKIYFIEKDRLAFYVGKGLNLGIKNLIKYKPILFTTEDGVDIFEGDKYCWVRKLAYYKSNDYIIAKDNSKVKPDYIYFSTKEAAEKYILMNKPCLSINDVMNNVEFNYSSLLSTNINNLKNNLKNFVKDKL